MMDTAQTNAYLDKIVEYYKDCQNDRKEIVASPCYKLEYRNQSEEQILYEYLKNKGKNSQQDNHLNDLNGSLDQKLRERFTPRPSSDDQNDSSQSIRQSHSDLSLSSTLHNSNLHPQESSSLMNSNQAENKPSRGNEMLAALRSKAKAQKEKDEKIRAASPSSSTILAQPKNEELDTSNLDLSNLDMNTSRIEERNERLNQSGVSDLTLDNEGDYPDRREKARLAEEPDLLNKTLRSFEPKKREKEEEEEKQTKQQQSVESKKVSKLEELRRQHKEKAAADQKRLEQEKLEDERRKREEEERLKEEERRRERLEKERREREDLERMRQEQERRRREQEEAERKKREEEKRRREQEEAERARQKAIEEEREREREKAILDAQIKEEKEAKERQRIKEEQLRREEEEEEKREKERLRVLNEEAEERRRKRDEARLIADQIKNQRDVVDTVQSIREDFNPVPKQSEGPFYTEKNAFGMQNSFSFQQGSLHESQYDITPGSPKSQTSERLREQRGEGTTNLLNGIKGSRRINREDSRHGSNVDSNETRDRFDGRSTTGQRTIPDRLKRIEELLERVLENQMNLERRLDRIEKTQGDHTEIIEDIRDSVLS